MRDIQQLEYSTVNSQSPTSETSQSMGRIIKLAFLEHKGYIFNIQKIISYVILHYAQNSSEYYAG